MGPAGYGSFSSSGGGDDDSDLDGEREQRLCHISFSFFLFTPSPSWCWDLAICGCGGVCALLVAFRMVLWCRWMLLHHILEPVHPLTDHVRKFPRHLRFPSISRRVQCGEYSQDVAYGIRVVAVIVSFFIQSCGGRRWFLLPMFVAQPILCLPVLWPHKGGCVLTRRNPENFQSLLPFVRCWSWLSLSNRKLSPRCWQTAVGFLWTRLSPPPLWWRWRVDGYDTDLPILSHCCPSFVGWGLLCPSQKSWLSPIQSPPWRRLSLGRRRSVDQIRPGRQCCL